MNKKIPKIIEEVGFDFRWDEEKVWKLDLPVEEIEIKELVWHFKIPFWWENGEKYNLKPQTVIDNPEQHQKEYDRILQADMSYPLDIMFWRSRWLLLDGLHRLAKAYVQNQKTIKVRKVPIEMIPQIKK